MLRKTMIFWACAMICLISARAGVCQQFDPAEYRVGVDDVLDINILKPEKLSITVNVSPDGSVSMVYLGNVRVKGLTLSEIQNEIQNRLADGYMNYPLVSVFVKESRSRKFFVYGDVARPGSYSMDHTTTVLKAISMAGGFSKNSASSNIKILRSAAEGAGYRHIDVDMKAVMQGSSKADVNIEPGDTLIVSEGNFSIYGDVVKPGVYPLEDNTTILKAISMAGGLSRSGASSSIRVLRPKKDSSGTDTIIVDIKAVMDGSSKENILLETLDTIVVSEEKFFVYGEVGRPGVYPLEDDTTVLKAISMAGGLSKPGSSSSIRILRPKKEGTPNDTITIDIQAVLKGSSEANIKVLANDSIAVSEEKFFVYGEVNKPGIYPMEANTTVLKAISMAGGFTKFGSSSRVKILRPSESGKSYETIKVNIKDIMEGFLAADVPIKTGDTVVISEGMF
ncbi:MAG TPA: SLBB domain-containing protein [Candidatus Omnitrophota bacterium]|nr:SLBB domain-containing protein [Candidatus Omnitrophota bacterium]